MYQLMICFGKDGGGFGSGFGVTSQLIERKTRQEAEEVFSIVSSQKNVTVIKLYA